MKHLYVILTLLTTVNLYGQETFKRTPVPYHNPKAIALQARETLATVTDTILYPYYKELVLSTGTESFFIDAMVGNVRTAAQGYTAPQTISIKGVQFWGAAYTVGTDPKNIQVVVSVWATDAQFMPITELTTTTINVTEAYQYYTALFPTPQNHTGNYAVTARAVNNSDTLAVVTNNAGDPANTINYGEGLAWRRFGSGTWNTSFNFFGQDLEYMIFPIVEYTVTTDFTTDAAATTGTEELFPNTASPLFLSRMYNLNVFDDFFGISVADSTFTWDYGDGTTEVQLNGAHTYSTQGSRNVRLIGDLEGYYTAALDTVIRTVTVTFPLPAKLGYFTGQAEGNGNLLKWNALTEENVAHYAIERSSNGTEFTQVGSVSARNVHNSSYSFLDANAGDISYYRLKTLDKDGRFERSRTIVVTRNKELFTVRPVNIKGGAVQLNVITASAGKVTISATNASGMLLFRKEYVVLPGENKLPMTELRHAASGVYHLNITDGRNTRTVSIAR